MSIISKRLKSLREHRNLKQKDVAKDLSLTPYQLSRYENDSSKPDPNLILQFSKYYNVSTDYLLGNIESDEDELHQIKFYKEKVGVRVLSKRIKQLREGRKITQLDLANKVGVSHVSISGYENGNRVPDFENLMKLANFFGVTTDFLLGRTNLPDSKEETLGARLKIAREKSGYKQTEVAQHTNINNKTLSGYENNISEPDAKTLVALADFYNVPYEWLLTGEGNATVDQGFYNFVTNPELERWYTELPKSTEEDLMLLKSMWEVIKEHRK